jgi:DNA-binding XRE family transcriptional regulator/quercetin dioxygenase-like cupin family protein
MAPTQGRRTVVKGVRVAEVPAAPVVNLGARLRRVRQDSGLSLREVARQLGVSPSFVSQLETGKSQPSVATLYSLAQLLDVPIDQLFAADPLPSVTHASLSGSSPGGAPASSRVTDEPASDANYPEAVEDPAVSSLVGRSHGGSEDDSTQGSATGATAAAVGSAPGSWIGSGDASIGVNRADLGSPADAWPRDGGGLSRLSVTRPRDRARIVMDSGVIWEQLARNTGHELDFMEVVYPPGSSSTNDSRMLRHNGYEYGVLLEGELEVTFGFETFVLRAGEAMGLDSTVPHLFNNRGRVAARGIWCVVHRRG